MRTAIHGNIPTRRAEREQLRAHGQFWTPDWIADAMVSYVAKGADIIFDPSVGMGAFYAALKRLGIKVGFYGADISHAVLEKATALGVFDPSCEIEVRDFILTPPQRVFKAIVANPPYIRHHRLSPKLKSHLREISMRTIGDTLDGRAGLHIFFLLQALALLKKGGRLAFIMPADTCEGVFAEKLWSWISSHYSIAGVITFEHAAAPFPRIDTNAVIFLIKNESPKETLKWIRCRNFGSKALLELMKKDLMGGGCSDLDVHERDLTEALSVGLSRSPRTDYRFEFCLSDFAFVRRGIATGANDFFFLTKEKAKTLNIPDKYFLQAIGRVRDVQESVITQKTTAALDRKGRPTLLFSPNGIAWENMAAAAKNYIAEGEKMDLPKRALISTRKPWYKMEERKIPPFLFAYLGRRNARFIKNEAQVVPLTSFLCVYPRFNDELFIEKLWQILQHPDTIANLKLVGKSYGSGAIKVEPRALEKLPIHSDLVKKYQLKPSASA